MEPSERLRRLPKVDRVAGNARLGRYLEPIRTRAARMAVDRARVSVLAGSEASLSDVLDEAVSFAEALSVGGLRRVVNLSGVVLHTGLGRARLATEAAEAMAAVGSEYSNLEFDVADGRRGDRQTHVAGLLSALTGAENALVVNNAAGAVFLALSALASGREVVLSRGQMVEIGGSFRMPDIVRASGCKLIEVGCTNRTRLSDYENALGPDSAAILRCHPSNFAIVGFTEEVHPKVLASLASGRGLPLIDDQGSGLLVDLARFGMPCQATLADSVRWGADIVVASGDKLLGGPQAGLILGRRRWIEAIAKHSLARALRVGKSTVAALEATLRLYRDGREMEIPTLRDLGRPLDAVLADARCLAEAWGTGADVQAGVTEAGSGASPGSGVPTWRVGLATNNPDRLLGQLRGRKVPIVGRIEKGAVWLDPRTAQPDDLRTAMEALREIDAEP